MTSNVKFLLIIPLLVALIEIIDARAPNEQGFAVSGYFLIIFVTIFGMVTLFKKWSFKQNFG